MTNDFEPLKKEEMDQIFDNTLRPLWSKSARTIFKVLLDSDKSYMTTLDIQDKIKKFNLKLSKKEINNWLTSLQEANFVSKEENRGKPTTIEYNGRYTFDLWRTTKNGEEIAQKVAFFLDKYPYTNGIENSSKSGLSTFLDLKYSDIEKIKKYYIISEVISHLSKASKKYANSYQISKKIGIAHEELLLILGKFNEKSNCTLYEIDHSDVGNLEKILALMGLRPQRTYKIEITGAGQEFAEKALSPPKKSY